MPVKNVPENRKGKRQESEKRRCEYVEVGLETQNQPKRSPPQIHIFSTVSWDFLGKGLPIIN